MYGPFTITWERWKGCAHDWATALRVVAALDRTVGKHPAKTREQQRRVCSGAHNSSQYQGHKGHGSLGLPQGRLQWVCTARVCRVWHTQKWKWFVPEGLLKGGTVISQLWAGDWAWPLLLWSSEKAPNAFREQKPHRWPAYTEPRPLTRGGATLPRQWHLRSSTAGPSHRRQVRETGGLQLYGTHKSVKLQCQGKIVYWATGVFSWLIYYSD